MKVKYQLKSKPAVFYEMLINSTKHDMGISEAKVLKNGDSFTKVLPTMLGSNVKTKILIKEIVKNKIFSTELFSNRASVITTWKFEEVNNKNYLYYEEKNIKGTGNYINNDLVSFFLTPLLKHKMKKRIKRIDEELVGA